MNSKTPRTDAEEYDAIANTNSALLANDKQYVVLADFARTLEREVSVLLAALERIVQLNEVLPADHPGRLSHGEYQQALSALNQTQGEE